MNPIENQNACKKWESFFKEAKQAGIKEVVDWVDDYMNRCPLVDIDKIAFIIALQSKLKEWGSE